MMTRHKSASIKEMDIEPQDWMYGKFLISGDRSALVVRCYEDAWTTFYYVNSHAVVTGHRRADTSKAEALRNAKEFIQSGNSDFTLVANKDQVVDRYTKILGSGSTLSK